ncbi:serine hydrolase [Fulvivirgaceae bacterium BMA10]|uniref:Serine hydrolase n=1 Tax=Splendidivirga corallicola TaxID=3051826 RepID=A0ABT8KRZ5_9BACT|nr:serine hydrolase [Fulvivirgaceae bacterium BMA10]
MIHKTIRIAVYLLLVHSLPFAYTQPHKSEWMRYSNPVEGGFDNDQLKMVKEQFSQMNSASYMVVHSGHVVLSLGDISRRFMCHSMRKSIMSAMYGIYVDKSKVNLYATLDELGIDDKRGLTTREKQARIHDLITARSGIYHPAAYEPRGMKENRPQRGSRRPGEEFFYNNWDFNVLVTILEQSAQINFFDATIRDLANPLGMQDLRREDMSFRYNPESDHPAYLFKMSTRDLARFGQLYLNKGAWRGQQIITESWVEKSTSAYSSDLPGFKNRGGYGYLWWVDQSTFSEPCYYASGLGGHRVFIFPRSKLVIVHNVNTYLNQFEREENINKLVQLTLDAKSKNEAPDPALELLTFEDKTPRKVKLSKRIFAQYQGDYQHPFFGKISVVPHNDNFFIKGNKLGSFRIFPLSKTEFFIEDVPELTLIFEPSSEKNAKGTAITKLSDERIPISFNLHY